MEGGGEKRSRNCKNGEQVCDPLFEGKKASCSHRVTGIVTW